MPFTFQKSNKAEDCFKCPSNRGAMSGNGCMAVLKLQHDGKQIFEGEHVSSCYRKSKKEIPASKNSKDNDCAVVQVNFDSGNN